MKVLLHTSKWIALGLGLLLLGPLAVWATGEVDLKHHWSHGSRDRVGLAPSPTEEPRAVVQVYVARAVGWRGLFAVHPWVAVKPAGADDYTIYQVTGWSLRYRDSAVSVHGGMPDHRWYGNRPQLLVDHRGARAARLIERIETVLDDYPYAGRYGLWPGPNSNTFVAWLARQVPELGLSLPVTAIGKDYLGTSRFVDRVPSGTGWQVSLWGLAGISLALQEGLELNLLGTGIGVDLLRPAIKWPGLGRIGLRRDLAGGLPGAHVEPEPG